jgi:hypothetical protein
MNLQIFERNQKMTKRIVVAGLLAGTVLFILSGCNEQQSQSVTETQEAGQAQVTEKAKEPEAVKEPEVVKAPEAVKEPEVVKKLEEVIKPKPAQSTKLTLRINCGATEPYTDKAGNVWLADQSMDIDKKWGAVDGLTVDRGDLGITAWRDTNSPFRTANTSSGCILPKLTTA